jgi:hypothetical protein
MGAPLPPPQEGNVVVDVGCGVVSSSPTQMPSLGWNDQRRICDPCLPLIVAQLDKVMQPTTQWQKDRTSVVNMMGGQKVSKRRCVFVRRRGKNNNNTLMTIALLPNFLFPCRVE